MIARSRLLRVLWLIGLGSACGARSTSPGQPPAPTTPAPTTPASAFDATTQAPSAPSALPASADPTREAPTAAEARALAAQNLEPPMPIGPGVRCGDMDCKPGWFCCLVVGDAARCLPQTQARSCKQGDRERLRACDDASDCGAGNVCCESREYEGSTSCRPMKDCTRKLCARGDTCLNDDYTCLSDGSSPTGGQCVYRRGTTACGHEARCSGDTPWCLWDRPTRSGECVEPLAGLTVLRCTSEKDCPSELACCWVGIAGGDAHCGTSCLDMGTTLLCSDDAECSYVNQLLVPLGVPPWRCLPLPIGEAPPGVKACVPVGDP